MDLYNTDVRKVSIHASAREATDILEILIHIHKFQSTPPRGRRLPWLRKRRHGLLVSIHASAREATAVGANGGVTVWRFNPRLREGGDKRGACPSGSAMDVSIHASAREAPRRIPEQQRMQGAFQSTPPRGRRRGVHRKVWIRFPCFNPRLREGGDWSARRLPIWQKLVSIHASAREATALITKIHLKHHISF